MLLNQYELAKEVTELRTEARHHGWEVIQFSTPLRSTVNLVKDGVDHFMWCVYMRPAVRKRFVWSGMYLSTWDGSDEATRAADGLPFGWLWKFGPGSCWSELLVDDCTDVLPKLDLISVEEKR